MNVCIYIIYIYIFTHTHLSQIFEPLEFVTVPGTNM